MAENAYLDDGGLQQVVSWLREKDVGEHQEGYYTSEIFNDYENNIALGPYNHIEGGNNIIADTTDKYYAYAGNPFLDIPSDIKLINLVENSSNYHINSEQGIFSLENIELPEIFTVNNYAEDININEYDYIQKDNKWYPIQQSEIDLVNYQNIENMLSDIFGKANTISSVKIFSSAEEPTIPTENLILYNSLAYYGEKTYNLSAEEVTLLTSINTLEIQDNNYITTIYLNESNNFGFVYIIDTNEEEDIIEDAEVETTTDILAEDTNTEDTNNEDQGPTSGDYFSSHSLLINQYDKDNVLSIENLTNQIGNFQLINQVYLPHPSAATKENAVYGTNITGIAEYGNQTNLNWEYLNNYDIQLELQPIIRELDEEGNEINPLKVEVNSTTLVNATIDYSQDSLIFVYQEEIDDTGIITSQKWYLNNNEVDLSKYGITVANAEDGDSFTIYLNKEYISDNEVLTQSEFYKKNHAAEIETYIFQGDNQKWIKKKPDEKVGNERYTYNHIEGYNNQAKGEFTHTEGFNNNNLKSTSAHVEGHGNRLEESTASHIEGFCNTLINGNVGSHVEGHGTTIDGAETSHAEGFYTKITSGHYHHVENQGNEITGGNACHASGYYNKINSSYNVFVSGQTNEINGSSHSIISGLENTVQNDDRSIISGMSNKIGFNGGSYENIICGERNSVDGGGQIVSGQDNKVVGDYNLVLSNGLQLPSGAGNIVSTVSTSSLSGDYNLLIGTSQKCSGDNNLISGGFSNINGDYNIAAGIGKTITGNYNAAFNNWNTIEGNFNFITGDNNNIKGNAQNLLGNDLVHNQSKKSATIIGESNQDTKTFFLTSDTTIQDDKIYYFDSKGQNQVIKNYNSKPSSPKDYYELDSSGEYVKTTDTEWIEGKKYYNQNGDRMFFTGDTIDEVLYEESYHLFIAGNGIYGKRSNALELDYRGNLNTSGDIVNGDGVIVGASISNEVLDNIWNEVFA